MQTFDEICRRFCAFQGLKMPDVNVGSEGVKAITFECGGVTMTAVHDERIDVASMFLVAELTDLPPGSETDQWFALMEANWWLRSENSPVFSRDPQTGKAMLQWTLPLGTSTPRSLHDSFARIVGLARRWKPAEAAAEIRFHPGTLPMLA